MTSLQNLFVAKLPRNLTDADLCEIFSDFHPTSAKVMLDATTGKSKGFGFVLFDSESTGRSAYEKLNKRSTVHNGHHFNLSIFPSKHDGRVAMEESNTLYVRNIPTTLSQMDVEKFLYTFGTVTFCGMREDNSGGNVWVVYVEYDTVESAKKALNDLHGNRKIFGSAVPILAKYADSEEAKRERRRRRGQQALELQQKEMQRGTTQEAPLEPKAELPVVDRFGNDVIRPHQFAMLQPGMALDGGAAPGQLPMFATVSQHFAPARRPLLPQQPLPPPPPPPQQLQPQPQPMQQPSPTTTQLLAPNSVYGSSSGHQRPVTPNSVTSFLNVTFNPGNVNGFSGNSSAHFGGQDTTPSRGSPCTPLNFSFSEEFDTGAQQIVPPWGNSNHHNSNGESGLLAPVTPQRRSSSTSTSYGGYRHNPYAPITPVSSVTSSAGPSTPTVAALQPATTTRMNLHYSCAPQQRLMAGNFPSSVAGGGYFNSHFSNNNNNNNTNTGNGLFVMPLTTDVAQE